MITDIQDEENLPSDVESLHLIINGLIIKNELLTDKNGLLSERVKSLTDEINLLKEQLALLKAKRFGRSSEKLDQQINELELRIEEKEILATASSTYCEDTKEKKRPKRLKLPDHLERTDVIIPAPSTCNSCGGGEFRKISDDISEVLEYVPSSFKVVRHIRPRCACINCEQIVQGYAPSNTIDKGKAGSGLLAHILVQKYCNHLPLYRQSQIYAREGIEIARSTMTGWAGQCSKLLEPLIEELKSYVFAATHIHGDDTPVKVLAPGTGKTKTGRIWTYVRDSRGYGDDNTPPAVCYFYSPDRKGERPLAHLQNFSGTLHADAYAGYDKMYGDQITEAACWAHVRRKFYEVTVASNNASIATGAVEEIGKIYEIEQEIRGMEPEERLKNRQKQSKELVEKLFASFKRNYDKLPKKSMTAKAINYALNNEFALKRFLDDGKIEIDNNTAERALRSVALGRKNWLFAGSDDGGETAAAFYSLIETTKLNNINPWQYLRQVLATIQDHNSTKLAQLLPWNIKLI
jgi:transposase